MTRLEAKAAAKAAMLEEPEFFLRISVRRAHAGSTEYVCDCHATEACFYTAKTAGEVAGACKFMLDSMPPRES